MLDRLSIVKELQESNEEHEQNTIAQLIPPEVQEQLGAIKARYAKVQAKLGTEAAALTADIKQQVLAIGHTVTGESHQAKWVKGRTSWDTRALTGYAIAHPEVLELKKTGNPSVSIAPVKGK
tara:strand:- start:1012 stop:1377 length:366 start_codon:yes stop_codon:yes gene_type:complete